jgi:hypothetical protein
MESDDHGNPIYPRIPFLFSDPFSLDRLGYYSQLADQTNRGRRGGKRRGQRAVTGGSEPLVARRPPPASPPPSDASRRRASGSGRVHITRFTLFSRAPFALTRISRSQGGGGAPFLSSFLAFGLFGGTTERETPSSWMPRSRSLRFRLGAYLGSPK